jgi:hypothetical protein
MMKEGASRVALLAVAFGCRRLGHVRPEHNLRPAKGLSNSAVLVSLLPTTPTIGPCRTQDTPPTSPTTSLSKGTRSVDPARRRSGSSTYRDKSFLQAHTMGTMVW